MDWSETKSAECLAAGGVDSRRLRCLRCVSTGSGLRPQAGSGGTPRITISVSFEGVASSFAKVTAGRSPHFFSPLLQIGWRLYLPLLGPRGLSGSGMKWVGVLKAGRYLRGSSQFEKLLGACLSAAPTREGQLFLVGGCQLSVASWIMARRGLRA